MNTPSALGVNPASITDYYGDLAFRNAVAHSRGFNSPGAAYDYSSAVPLDDDKNPTRDFGILFATVPGTFPDASNFAPIVDGRYWVRFEGTADVFGAPFGTYDAASNTTTGTLDMVSSPSNGGVLSAPFTNTRRLGPGTPTNTGVGDLKIIRPDPANPGVEPTDWDEVFSPQFLRALAPFGTIRFLDWAVTNNATEANSTDWSARRRIADRNFVGEVPYEHMFLLCNKLKANCWVPLPIYASDDYVTSFHNAAEWGTNGDLPYTGPHGSTVTALNPRPQPADGPEYPGLDPDLQLKTTYGNETWNDFFPATGPVKYNLAPAHAAAHPELGYSVNLNGRAAQYCAYMTVHWRDLASKVHGEENFKSRFYPIFESQQGGQDQTAFGLVKIGLDFIAKMDSRPVNRKICATGASWYHTPPALIAFEAQGANPFVYPTPDQTFAVPPSASFPAIPALFQLAHRYGLDLVCYEGGEVFSNDPSFQPVPIAAVQNDPRYAAYVASVINQTLAYASCACVYGLTQVPWNLLRSTNDLTSAEATKYKATLAAMAANAGVTPPVGYPDFAPVDYPITGTDDGAPLYSTGMIHWTAGRYEVAFPAQQPTTGPGMGVYIDGAAAGVGSFSLVDGLPSGGTIVRIPFVITADGYHIVEVRQLQTLTYGYGAHLTILPAPTIPVATPLVFGGDPCTTNFAAATDGAELSQVAPWLAHVYASTYNVDKADGLAAPVDPSQQAFYRRQLDNSVVDYDLEVQGIRLSASQPKFGFIGRDGGDCELNWLNGQATMTCKIPGSSANIVLPTGPVDVAIMYWETDYRVSVNGAEVYHATLPSASGGSQPGFIGQACFAGATLSTIATVAAPGAPTAPTTLGLALPGSATVGTAGTASVTLSGGPAASTDTAVALAYSGATGPASVTVPAGSLSVTFAVTPTATSYTVTPTATGLSGSGSGETGSATSPSSQPTAPTTMTLALPSSTTVGTAGTATVTLSGGTASSSAIVVALAYSGATGPASVTVAAGALVATFQVTPTATTYSATPTATGLAGSGTPVAGTATNPAPTGPTTLALTLPPSSTVAGSGGTATITLSGGSASSAATAVALAYSGATGPSTATIAAGSLSATFQVTPTATSYTVTPTATGLAGSGTAVAGTATAPSNTGSGSGPGGTGLTSDQAAALALIPTLGAKIDALATAVGSIWSNPSRTLTGFAFNVSLSASGLDNIPTTPPTRGAAWNFRQLVVMTGREVYGPAKYDKAAGTITHYADDGASIIIVRPYVETDTTASQGLAT